MTLTLDRLGFDLDAGPSSGAGGGGSPGAWLLATGFWADSGVWDDSANWID